VNIESLPRINILKAHKSKNMAQAVVNNKDKSTLSAEQKQAINENLLPSTQQLYGNLLIRGLLSSVGILHFISPENIAGRGIALATSSMWLTEDITEIIKRHAQINSGKYKSKDVNNKLLNISYADIKTPNDVQIYAHNKQHQLSRPCITLDAAKEILHFLSFDIILDAVMHKDNNILSNSTANIMLVGALAYPILNLFDKAIPKIGKYISKPFFRTQSPDTIKQTLKK
jgi:hypothetical protein